MTNRAFPPPIGELTSASLLAFCSYPDGTLRGSIIYRCMRRYEFSAAIKLGWVPMAWHVGVSDTGNPLGLFAWLCQCKMVVPI